MTADETYDGWTNHETWAVALHINNDQSWQESVFEALGQHRYDDGPSDDLDVDTMTPYAAGCVIRENVESVLSGDEFDNYVEALRILADIGSLWRVNWDELGAAFLLDLQEQ